MQRMLAIMLLLPMIGCSQVGNYLNMAQDKGISTGYLEVLNRWSRKETVYSQFETKVQISATYKSVMNLTGLIVRNMPASTI